MGDGPRSQQVEAFIGVSPKEARGTPSLEEAFTEAARLASEAGFAGVPFDAAIEVVPEAHNQYVRTYRVIITPHG